jgi:hypothetical protein
MFGRCFCNGLQTYIEPATRQIGSPRIAPATAWIFTKKRGQGQGFYMGASGAAA